jgi:hypothetical protein
MSYEHMRAHEEPILCSSDSIAWAYGDGRYWRKQTELLIDKTIDLDP